MTKRSIDHCDAFFFSFLFFLENIVVLFCFIFAFFLVPFFSNMTSSLSWNRSSHFLLYSPLHWMNNELWMGCQFRRQYCWCFFILWYFSVLFSSSLTDRFCGFPSPSGLVFVVFCFILFVFNNFIWFSFFFCFFHTVCKEWLVREDSNLAYQLQHEESKESSTRKRKSLEHY